MIEFNKKQGRPDVVPSTPSTEKPIFEDKKKISPPPKKSRN
jgi:hypothetical protein